MQQRKSRNYISQLTLSNGEVCTDQTTIKEAILDHYQNFLGTEKARNGAFDNSEFQEKIVPDHVKFFLCRMVTEKEIKEALWSIKDDKSPGPDGFNNYFFKKSWSIVGKEICCAVQDFFSNGVMLKHANSTIITLSPR